MAKKRDRPADPVQRERARVLDACERLGLDLVRFLYVDHGGVVRGKATSRARLEERLATGIGLTVAMQAMSMLDELATEGYELLAAHDVAFECAQHAARF